MRARTNPPMLLNLYKSEGITSFDVIRQLKRLLGRDHKYGHFGTLDPFATGVLLVGLNKATKLTDLAHECFLKTYTGIGLLGVETDTLDMTGQKLRENSLVDQPDKSELQRLAQQFVGVDYYQAPPVYSAAKFRGRPLYSYAREGQTVSKPPVLRRIHRFEIVSVQYPEIHFRCQVSTGTYIRVLFSDLAKSLGTIGSLKTLSRQAVGPFESDSSVDLASIESPKQLLERAVAVNKAMPLHHLILNEDQVRRLSQGQTLHFDLINAVDKVERPLCENLYWACDEERNLLGMVRRNLNEIKVHFNFVGS